MIITLCGSTRFKDDFATEMARLTLEGHIVIGPGLFGHAGDLPPEQTERGNAVKDMLDEMHLRKIDLAERVHVINRGGYIGESTAREIQYAAAYGKTITHMESASW